jgi:hypothetical protein
MKGDSDPLIKLLRDAKRLAKDYYALTGRPLGVTGEIAECEAVRLLGLEHAEVRQAGYDAIRRSGRRVERLQIKGRHAGSQNQRVGSVGLKKEWDAVLLVLLNEDFDTREIYEAPRATVTRAVLAPGSRARNEREQLSVRQFKAIGKRVWPPEA